MKRILAFTAILVFCLFSGGNNTAHKAKVYVDSYSFLAISEMYRCGIPASITLAQGLLESNYGTSALATKANNHFGIKCHSDWKGPSVSMDDDAKGECFRKYDKVEDSYYDHSDFLRYKSRYAFLFELEITDYKSWAYGLKKAGYATDPSYASKLIALIEKYNLDRFDKVHKDSASCAVLPQTPAELEQPSRYTGNGRSGTFAVVLQREVLSLNKTPFVYARSGETYRTIAAQYDLFPKELAGFNDSDDPDRKLTSGEPVYLQRKPSKAVKGLEKHVCEEGETLCGIAAKYAVNVKSLMKYNGIRDKNHIFRNDDTVFLRPKK